MLSLLGCVVWQGFDWGRVGDVIEHESGVQPPQSESGEKVMSVLALATDDAGGNEGHNC